MRTVEWVLIALTAALAVIVPLGVFFRYALGAALPWTDELGGFLLAWITFLGSVMALNRHAHVGFDQITQSLPAVLRRAVTVTLDLALAAFLVILVVYGSRVSARLMGQMAVSMPLPTGLVYSVLPISGLLMLIVLVARHTGIARMPDAGHGGLAAKAETETPGSEEGAVSL